jgi:F0F1-type ATP synthase membrane subunit b/b'
MAKKKPTQAKTTASEMLLSEAASEYNRILKDARNQAETIIDRAREQGRRQRLHDASYTQMAANKRAEGLSELRQELDDLRVLACSIPAKFGAIMRRIDELRRTANEVPKALDDPPEGKKEH